MMGELLQSRMRKVAAELMAIADAMQGVVGEEPIGTFRWVRGSGELKPPRGKPIRLTKTEEKVLGALCDQRGSCVSESDLIILVMGADCFTATIRAHISSLRAKLSANADCIKTVHGRGYMLVME